MRSWWERKDGSKAMKLASENQFDVCILDLNLPDTTGYDLVGRLLEIRDNNRPLTMALTDPKTGTA